ncbi:MAG TPA: hypothetical protein VHH34_12675 [Pseudonocardiaceae bacterium]|nr:hypothetical protein [Pseudonocardiaceae bacterium]
MSTPNSTGNGTSSLAAVAGSSPVILVRYRADRTGETARIVHLAPLPEGGVPSAPTALCGVLLPPEDVEQVGVGEGTPCTLCAVSHVSAMLPPGDTAPDAESPLPGPAAGPSEAAAVYRDWGWPVTLRRDQVWLTLGSEAVALMVPAVLANRVTTVLTARRCLSAMLTHPYAPEHRVLLAGEPYPVPLPWPPGVHRVATSVLLPPTTSPRGPLTWARSPHPDALVLCREIDVLAALRTTQDESPPATPTVF